jgi:hypothetical protein
MQITTRTAVFPQESIQSAYNSAVLQDRTLLAREIEILWLTTLKERIAEGVSYPLLRKPRAIASAA